ncbi:MAG: hypothetical protein ACR2GT_05980 [Gaiellaceae bacterium]
MTMLAAIRPDSVNLPLFLHVLGAMLLMGSLLAVAVATALGWRRSDDAAGLARFSLLTLLLGVVPSYVLMRIGAQWTEAEQSYPDDFAPAWIGVGYITADGGAFLTIVSIVLAAVGLRRLRRGDGIRLARAVGVISILLLAAYLVAVWAMTAKPM